MSPPESVPAFSPMSHGLTSPTHSNMSDTNFSADSPGASTFSQPSSPANFNQSNIGANLCGQPVGFNQFNNQVSSLDQRNTQANSFNQSNTFPNPFTADSVKVNFTASIAPTNPFMANQTQSFPSVVMNTPVVVPNAPDSTTNEGWNSIGPAGDNSGCGNQLASTGFEVQQVNQMATPRVEQSPTQGAGIAQQSGNVDAIVQFLKNQGLVVLPDGRLAVVKGNEGNVPAFLRNEISPGKFVLKMSFLVTISPEFPNTKRSVTLANIVCFHQVTIHLIG